MKNRLQYIEANHVCEECERIPSHQGIEWLLGVFSYYPDDLPEPYLFPTSDGGIRAEWSINSHEISIDINLESHVGVWHDLDMNTKKSVMKVVNMNDIKLVSNMIKDIISINR